MPRSNQNTAASNTVLGSPAAAAETAICQVTGISTQNTSDQVQLQGEVSLVIGTAGTGCQLRIRRGAGIAGPVVAVQNADTLAAAATGTFDIEGTDNPGEVANQTYTLTAQVPGATAASAVNQASLRAEY